MGRKLVRDHRPNRFIALCRCGGSKTKPFCDASHKRNGLDATERVP